MQDLKPVEFKTQVRFDIEGDWDYNIGIEVKTDQRVYLHLDPLDSWSKSVYIELLGILEEIKASLSLLGIQRVYVLVEEADTKLIKFETMMGFEFDTRTRS